MLTPSSNTVNYPRLIASTNNHGCPMYSHPSQFTPLMPSDAAFSRLEDEARQVVAQSYALTQAAHPTSLSQIRRLVRSMNSYYSNLIEGQSTHPANIDRALRKDFSDNPDVAKKQRIALAHIEAEKALEDNVDARDHPFSVKVIKACHANIYERLPDEDKRDHGATIGAGQFRQANVQVGRHVAPSFESLNSFLAAWELQYNRAWTDAQRLVVAPLAHHRLAWVHPFIDGNGRAARLQTHLALLPITQGLWSVNRGLARSLNKENGYYSAMAYADQLRQGDYDGRGNLSERALVNWAQVFISTCKDQVEFQQKMLDLDSMKSRIKVLVSLCSAQIKNIREEAFLPVYHLFAAGPLARSEFAKMTGLGERSARYLISALLKEEIIASQAHNAPLQFNLPLKHLHILLPNLYPEANTTNFDG